MAKKRGKKAKKSLKRTKKLGSVKPLSVARQAPAPYEVNPQPLPPGG